MAKQYKVSSLISFQHKFATEQACIEYLALLRWPDGYRCSKCGCQESYQLRVRPRVFMCSACNHQESVTAGTILQSHQAALLMWFWAAYLLIQDKRGISAKQLSRELNLSLRHSLDHAAQAQTGLVRKAGPTPLWCRGGR